jgi:Undecaprenyl-phosphate glucose phosphotransferase
MTDWRLTAKIGPQGRARRRIPREAASLVGALVEFVAVAAAVGIFLLFGDGPSGLGPDVPLEPWALASTLAGAHVAISALRGHYLVHRRSGDPRLTEAVLVNWTCATLIVAGALSAAGAMGWASAGPLVAKYLVGLAMLALLRTQLLVPALSVLGVAHLARRRVMLIGMRGSVESAVAANLQEASPLDIVATFGFEAAANAKTVGAVIDAAVERAHLSLPDSIVIAVPWTETDLIARLAGALMSVPVGVSLQIDPALAPLHRVGTETAPLRTIAMVSRPMTAWEAAAKRLFDICGATAGLVLLSPLFLLIGAAIRLEGPGPLLYRQARHGLNGATFTIYKFRSMQPGADNGDFRQAKRGDSRFTRVGRLIRRFNLDELPQLYNVLNGTMSLVGPRPHPVELNRMHDRSIPFYARRHNVKPGITGWAQINGLRGPTDREWKMRSRVVHDLFYVDNWSFWLDLKILFLTFFSPMSFRNAY